MLTSSTDGKIRKPMTPINYRKISQRCEKWTKIHTEISAKQIFIRYSIIQKTNHKKQLTFAVATLQYSNLRYALSLLSI